MNLNHLHCIVGMQVGGVVQRGSGTTQVRQPQYEFLCGYGAGNMSVRFPDDPRPDDCERCTLLDSVLRANVHPWWLREPPFSLAGDGWTLAARYYAFAILKTEAAAWENGRFEAWREAYTFERLRELNETAAVHLKALQLSGLAGDRPWQKTWMKQIGCHYCGTAPAEIHLPPFVPSCRVCGSTEITWTNSP